MRSALRSLFRHLTPPRKAPVSRRTRLELEPLEDRRVMSVTYHGGAVLQKPELQALFLGSDWTKTATYPTNWLDSFIRQIPTGSYMDMLGNAYGSKTVSNYGGLVVPPGTTNSYVTPAIGRGSASASVVDSSYSLAGIQGVSGAYLTDTQIRSEITREINAGGLQFPDANRLYLVFVEDNVAVNDDNNTANGRSDNKFTGYHDSYTAYVSGLWTSVRYAVITTPGGSVNNFTANSTLSPRDAMTLAASHELAEAVTDPDPASGWTDNTNGEIGDISQSQTVYLGGFAVQREADPNDQHMTPMGATTNVPTSFVLGTDNTLRMYQSGSATTVSSNVRSLSEQGIDNNGVAMVDYIDTSGNAFEYHAGGSSIQIGSSGTRGGAKSVAAGQGVSYLLYNDGSVFEYTDPTFNSSSPSTQQIDTTSTVTRLDAGTDHYGDNMVLEQTNWRGVYIRSDHDGIWRYLGGGFNSASMGQGGFVALLDTSGNARCWNENSGYAPANSPVLASQVTAVSAGTDQNGNAVLDYVQGGQLWVCTAYGGNYRYIDYNVRSISKSHAGYIVDVSNANNAYLFPPNGTWSNGYYSKLQGNSQVAA